MTVTMTSVRNTNNMTTISTNNDSKSNNKDDSNRGGGLAYCDGAVSIPETSACFGSMVNRHSFKASPR